MKIKKLLYLSFVFFIWGNSANCRKYKNPNCIGKWDERLKFTNNSPYNLYVVHTNGYPDSSVSSIANHSHKREHYIEIGITRELGELCDWENYFNKYVPSGFLMIYIFKDTVNTGSVNTKDVEYDLNKVIKYPFLKRYDLTLGDLKAMNWTVTYP